MQPSESEWTFFYSGLARKTGIQLAEYRQPQLRRRLMAFAVQLRCSTLGDLWNWVSEKPENVALLLDKLAINVTELFRNPERWQDFEKKVLPELTKGTWSLRCWSAGCSYGAEAVTLSMILHANVPGRHTIVGTDIDQAALSHASKGVFGEHDVVAVPAEYKTRYLKEVSPKVFKADAAVMSSLRFQRQNLLADRFDSNFDLIMCRNVVIYFSDEAKEKLYQRFFAALKPGGVLFVGSTERIFRANEMGFSSPWPFFYRKPLLEAQKWQRAS